MFKPLIPVQVEFKFKVILQTLFYIYRTWSIWFCFFIIWAYLSLFVDFVSVAMSAPLSGASLSSCG